MEATYVNQPQPLQCVMIINIFIVDHPRAVLFLHLSITTFFLRDVNHTSTSTTQVQSSFSPDIDHELVVEAPVVKIMTQGADEHCQALEPGEFKYCSFIDALISFFFQMWVLIS